ncbi:hypothetical protein GUF51_15340, partial [Xanthomonas citri pv. citri]|nr:hypothetical protein [Xanthomonas citri pv. citri]
AVVMGMPAEAQGEMAALPFGGAMVCGRLAPFFVALGAQEVRAWSSMAEDVTELRMRKKKKIHIHIFSSDDGQYAALREALNAVKRTAWFAQLVGAMRRVRFLPDDVGPGTQADAIAALESF